MTYYESKERRKMLTNLTNLEIVYRTALGELFTDKQRIQSFWPVLFSIEQLGYYLDSSLKYHGRPVLPERDQAQLLYLLESLAIAVENNEPTSVKHIPTIEGFQKVEVEILALQKAFRHKETV